MGKVGKSVSKGFKKVTEAVIKKPLKQINNAVGGVMGGASSGGASSGGTTVIQQEAENAKQRYASEEDQTTEQGATDLKTRSGVSDKKKIKRLSTVSST